MAKTATGKYVFDAKLGKVVKISDRIPKVASKGKAPAMGPCGRPVGPSCGGGGGCGA